MVTQTAEKQQIIAVYKDWSAAKQAKETLQNSGLMAQKVAIDDHVEPYNQVASIGTTVGGEAGLWLGLFYGGVVGVILATIEMAWAPNAMAGSSLNQLTVVAFTIGGAVLGAIAGKRFRTMALPYQKTLGNPNMPRHFRLVINNGSPDEIAQAQQALGQPTGQSL